MTDKPLTLLDWDIFHTNDPREPWQLQRDDFSGRFPDDAAALDYVIHHPEQARLCIRRLLDLLNKPT